MSGSEVKPITNAGTGGGCTHHTCLDYVILFPYG